MFEVMTLMTCDGTQVAGAGCGRRRRVGDSCGGGFTPRRRRAQPPRTPDSLLHSPVFTALTSTILPPKRPVGIVGILGFFFGVQRRCACDVSTMDTSDLPALFRTTNLPRPPVRTSVSEVITPTCLRSEETAHDMPLTRVVASGAARPAHARLAKRSRRAASPPTTSTSSAETRVSGVAYSKGSPGLMRPKTVIP